MNSQPSYCIGLMSGTSLDGVDGVLAHFDAHGHLLGLKSHAYQAFEAPLREQLLALQQPGFNELERAALAANQLVEVYAEVVSALLQSARVTASAVDCIAAHGQTVRHRPERGYTWQINNPARLAELTKIKVVADLRSRDVAAGGQGAPLVPAFHQALFAQAERTRLIVNLGGIANVTRLTGTQQVAGYDIGPANVLLDAWTEKHLQRAYDANGAWASGGQVQPDLLEALLDEAFFEQAPPKSTGRDLFNAAWLDHKLQGFAFLPPEDVQRTLVELTAVLVAAECAEVDEVILCGGGAYNACLRGALAHLLSLSEPRAALKTSSELGDGETGIAPEHVEALAFAWLGWRCLRGLAGNLPQVTGAAGARVLGAIYPA